MLCEDREVTMNRLLLLIISAAYLIALKLQVSPTGGYDEHRHIRHGCRTPTKKPA